MSLPCKPRRNAAAAVMASVKLRGVDVALNTAVGAAFVGDCARHTERLLTADEIKRKWAIPDRDWERLADNATLLEAVRAERERRVRNGDAAREAAQRHFAQAPNVLGEILNDELVSPHHRIEAAKELRQAAAARDAQKGESSESFIVTIDLGGGEKIVVGGTKGPSKTATEDDDGPV
jgi:hypothetical protein